MIYLAEKEEEGEPARLWWRRGSVQGRMLATVRCTATLLAHTDTARQAIQLFLNFDLSSSKQVFPCCDECLRKIELTYVLGVRQQATKLTKANGEMVSALTRR